MQNTIARITNTIKNILLVAMIAGIGSFIAGANYQAHADSGHLAPVATTAPTKN